MTSLSEQKSKQRRRAALQKKYAQRISYASQAREFYARKDYTNAVKKYNEYLGIITEMKEEEDWFRLTPEMFSDKSDVHEVFLISQVFWELAKIYEPLPKARATFEKCMQSFVKFSIKQPFQHINAEILRKHIKKLPSKHPSKATFNSYLSKIYKKSSACYIATYYYGDSHWVTETLRNWRDSLLDKKGGVLFVTSYYKVSPFLVYLARNSRFFHHFFNIIFSPIIKSIAKYSKENNENTKQDNNN